MKRSVLSITLKKLIGFIIFLLILGFLNLIKFDSLVNLQIVSVLNQNIGIIITLTVLTYVGEVFSILKFPFNIPAPIFNALGGMFLVNFIFQILYSIGNSLNNAGLSNLSSIEVLAYFIVFLMILVIGYIKIIMNLHYEEKETRIKKINNKINVVSKKLKKKANSHKLKRKKRR